MKVCSKCGEIKSLGDFHKSVSRQDGLQSFCMFCRLKEQRRYRQTKLGKDRDKRYKERRKKKLTKPFPRTKRYLEQWLDFFIDFYGATPQCQICNKILTFNTTSNSSIVHFDHRHGGESISIEPSHFYRNHPCTDAHKQTWINCDFGILCLECNSGLRTLDRISWLRNALDYAVRSKV